MQKADISIVIPTYERGNTLLETLKALELQRDSYHELLVIDQTNYRPSSEIATTLEKWHRAGRIRWVQTNIASIPRAMNIGLLRATGTYVLFLDDDIDPQPGLVQAHIEGLLHPGVAATSGQVLQPGQQATNETPPSSKFCGLREDLDFKFNSTQESEIANCMAGNLAVDRIAAIRARGFDQNFLGVAYRFETEFCRRLCRTTKKICKFLPRATIKHLQVSSGGTRHLSQNHLISSSPVHGVGDYYFALREGSSREVLPYTLNRLIRSVSTRFHLRHPWYVPVKLLGEFRAISWARKLAIASQPLISNNSLPARKLAIVISHPIQHYSPLFRTLAEDPELDVMVFYLCDVGVTESYDPGFDTAFQWDVNLLDGYPYKVLRPGLKPLAFSLRETRAPEIKHALLEFQPDAIWLHGYSQGICLSALYWAKFSRHANSPDILLFGDSELIHKRSLAARLLKQIFLRLVFRYCDYFITVGDNNEHYYRHYGVPTQKFVRATIPIAVERLRMAREQTSVRQIEDLRTRLGIKENAFVVLFSGKLVDYKKPTDLVLALNILNDESIHIVFMGDGPEREKLEFDVTRYSLEKQVSITGFVNQQHIHKYLMLADVCAVTSVRDAHPLAVSESLVFGLPVIASDHVGCVGNTDTAQPGRNCIVYPAGNHAALANAISTLMRDGDLRLSYAKHSESLANEQKFEAVADKIKTLLLTRRPT